MGSTVAGSAALFHPASGNLSGLGQPTSEGLGTSMNSLSDPANPFLVGVATSQVLLSLNTLNFLYQA